VSKDHFFAYFIIPQKRKVLRVKKEGMGLLLLNSLQLSPLYKLKYGGLFYGAVLLGFLYHVFLGNGDKDPNSNTS
jgi:hypothetical protein